MNIKKKFYSLVLFDNIDDSKKFISDIIDIFKYYNDKYDIDNKELIFNDNLCVCNIKDNNDPDWKSECNFIINDYDKLNINHYRLIIYKFDDLIYYIEKNGNIRDLNIKIIKNINYCKYNPNFKIKNKDGIDSTDKLYKKISDFILGKDEFNDLYKNFCSTYAIPKINYDDDFYYNNIINLYEDLITNKILDSSKKLNDSDLNMCLNNNNENQYYNNAGRYNFLDLNICDIYYDIENKLLFNYKTEKGYTELYLQIIYALIILKIKQKKYLTLNFINKFNIDINNFKYVIGIIKNNDNNDNELKKSVGIICLFLNKLNIEYYIDII